MRNHKSNGKLAVFLIAEGTIEFSWNSGELKSSQLFTKGESILIPAALSEYQITTNGAADYYVVNIPSI